MAEKKQQQAKQAQIIQERDLGNGVDDRALLGSLNSIDKVIAVMSGKGGVGKSTVTALIATNLARSGKKVGVLDADITGPSQGKAFGIKSVQVQSCAFGMIPPLSTEGIKIMSINFLLPSEDDPVIWRGPMLAGAVKQFYEEVHWEDLDYLVVDLPPGTGDVPLTVMQSLPITGAVLVSSPQDLAQMVVRKTMKMAGKLGVPILGIIENMSYFTCPSCNEKHEIFGSSKGQRIAAEADMPFLGRLGWDPLLNVLMDKGSIEHYQNFEIDLVMKELKEVLES